MRVCKETIQDFNKMDTSFISNVIYIVTLFICTQNVQQD